MSSDEFGEQLGELPELDDGRRRVVAEVSLGKPAQHHQAGVVRVQKGEIRMCRS